MPLLANRLKLARSFLTILIAKDSSKFGDFGCEDLDCIKLAQNKIQFLPNTITKLCIIRKTVGLTS